MAIKISKKIIAISLALILLFNISGDVFASFVLPQNEVLSEEIKAVLEEAKSLQGKNSYDDCIVNKSAAACKTYLNNIKNQFIESANNTQESNNIFEGKKTYVEYEKEVKKAIATEYKRAEEEIEKEIRQALWFSDLSWDTANHLNHLEKQSKAQLNEWKENEEKNIKTNYKQYEKDYQAWQVKTQASLEAQGKAYLKKIGSNLIKIYDANKDSQLNDDIIEILSALLNSEETPGDFVENRLKAEEILLQGIQGDPCSYNAEDRKLNKTGELLTNLALINRNMYSTGANPIVLSDGAWDIIPATYKNPQKCQNAFYALEGLSHLKKSDRGVKAVLEFIKKNETGLAASDKLNNSLVSASAVLLKWKAYSTLKNYIATKMKEEKSNENGGFGGFGAIPGNVTYNGRYLGEISVYNQRDDGTNAWEDLADLLASEGSAQSKEILKSSISSCKVVEVVLGRDKLECQTIMPFLYGALLNAPKVMDVAHPYQEPIPQYKEYLDEHGKTRQVNVDAIKAKNAYIAKIFNEKMKSYGTTLSSGLAGFLYDLKFEDVPTDVKMFLDNRLAKVYKNISPYTKNSARYNELERSRAVVSIFKYYGTLLDIWCFISMGGLGIKALAGVSALTKAKRIVKGAKALSVAQRANLLRQVAFIREGAKLRRFGRNFTAGIVNSANIGRRINASAYLAEKNGMNPINYMLHNIAYQRGKNIVLRNNILRVEGSTNFFNSSHYIPEVHGNIFRINRDLRRASRIGVRELGEGGQVVSYVDKAKMQIFKNYTEDYIKGQEVLNAGTQAEGASLMTGETTLLPREYLYSRKYKKILAFTQDNQFSRTFNIGDKIYEGLRKEGLFVVNKKTGEVYNDFSFNFDGYLNKNNLLIGRELGIRTPKPQIVNSFTQSVANTNLTDIALLNPSNLIAPSVNTLSGLTSPLKALMPSSVYLPKLPKLSLYYGNIVIDTPFLKFNLNNINKNPKLFSQNISLGNNDINFIPGEDFPEVKAEHNYDYDEMKPTIIAGSLNILLKQLSDYAKKTTLSEYEIQLYNDIANNIYRVLDDAHESHSRYISALEDVDFFTDNIPLITFEGSNVETIRPANIEGDLLVYSLYIKDDYKKFIADKIKHLSAFHKDYTIYLSMHGDKGAKLAIGNGQYTSLEEIVNIISANKGDETVNIITSACHSGAALKGLSLVKKGINILLLSGRNDLCYTSDMQFVKINDLRSTYIEAVKNRYYGSYLIYDGKFFNALADANLYVKKGDKRRDALEFLRKIYFKEGVFGDSIYQLLINFPNHFKTPYLPFIKLYYLNITPSVFNPIFHEKELLDDYIHIFDPKKNQWEYVLNTYDRSGNFKEQESVIIEETSTEINDFLTNVAKKELEEEFPSWNYVENKRSFQGNFPLYPHTDDEFLSINSSYRLKKDFPIIPTQHIKEKKALIITKINKHIEKLKDIDVSTLSSKQIKVYQEVFESVKQIAKAPNKATIPQLRELEKMSHLLTMDQPILLFNGDGLDVRLPGHIPSNNFRIVKLSKELNYVQRIGTEIKDFVKVFDKFTIWVDMHGGVDGSLLVSNISGEKTYTRIAEVVRIAEANKGDSKIDLISASCHGGAGFISRFKDSNINILILSGPNEICYQTDKSFLVYNDLPATYLNALSAGRYGSYLIYNKQVYNPIKEALAKVTDPTLKKELEALKDIFLKKDKLGTELGKNIFKLLLNFDNYKLNTIFDGFDITKISGSNLHEKYNIPFVFNPILPKDSYASSFLTKRNDVWNYRVKIFDQNNNESVKNVSFEKLNFEISDFIYESNRENFAKTRRTYPILVNPQGPISDLPFIKTPKTLTKFFKGYDLDENLSSILAKTCFTGEKNKYNPAVFEKVQALVESGVEPKYLESMLTALSDNNGFSLDFYEKAVALHNKHNIPLSLSAYFVNMGLSIAGYEEAAYNAIDKLLENDFDFTKMKKSWDYLMEDEANNPFIKDLEISRVDLLSTFAKGGKEFNIDSWNNLINIAKKTEHKFSSFQYAMQFYIGREDLLEYMPKIIGTDNVIKALNLNYDRYNIVFPNMILVAGKENIPLLREQMASLPLENQLKIIDNFAALINLRGRYLIPGENLALIKSISTPQLFKENLNKIVFRKLGWEYTDKMGEIFDFSSNKYLMQILNAQDRFYVNLELLRQVIEANINKPINQLFDELPENKAFAALCKENGIDYQAWRGYDPKDSITRNVLINGGKQPITRMPITVRKVNMDDIQKALITGNESASCRAVGNKGLCGHASPNLIRNKMVQQIEIVANGKAVGNALLYLAKVDGQTSIVVGSFVKRVPYFSYEVTKLVMDYVRHIRKTITNEEIPIYYSSFLTINNFYNYPLREHSVKLLGEGYNEIFNSFTHEFIIPALHTSDDVKLYTIEEGKIPVNNNPKFGDDISVLFNDYDVNVEGKELLSNLCFTGEDKVFDPEILKAEKDLLSKNIEPRFIKEVIISFSPNGQFIPELYAKAVELSQNYGDNILRTSFLMEYSVEDGAFSPRIYEKIKLMYDKKVHFNKETMLQNCTKTGSFNDKLFDKALSLDERFGSTTNRIIIEFTDELGNFKEEYFEACLSLVEKTKDMFPAFKNALKDYMYYARSLQNAFDVLGIETASKAVLSNHDRYLNMFQDLLDAIDSENMILLKEKISFLPVKKQLEVLTLLAGTVNKKSNILNKSKITDLINMISDEKAFKEEINRIVFKQLNLVYTPEMAKIFDFASSRYVARILQGNSPFDNNLTNLFNALNTGDGKPLHQRFDELPENMELAKMCQEKGIDYQAWRGYNPNSFITKKVVVDSGREPIKKEEITVRKVDMDNVMKALTSGNESGACRAVGRGVCREAAPELVKNKMVQQVELLHGDKVVGNVLIYLAEVDGNLAIVMGSIIRKSHYYVSDDVNDLVIDYVRQIRKDIGREDIPIYMSTYLKVSNHYPTDWRNVQLIGAGDRKIFNSFTHDFEVPSKNKTNRVFLYEVDEGIKGQTDDLNIDYPSDTPKTDMLAQTAQKIEEKSYQNYVKEVKNQIKKEGIKSAGALAILCFEGEELTFNPAVLETIKDLAKKDIEGVFIIEMIKALSPNNHFEPKLYEKALELYETNRNMNESIKMIKGSMENGVFNPKILEKFQELQGYYFPLSEYDFMKACFVNGFFREDLYNKGISIAKEFTSNTPKILELCKTEEGAFDDKLFENFVTLAKNTAKSFSFEDPLLEYLIAGEGIKFSLEVMGAENTAKAINLNKARYKNIFLSLAGNMYKENRPLLKAQLEPLPLEEKLAVLNQLSGILNKKTIFLTPQEEREVLNQTPDKEKFKETINRLSFKHFGFEYMPALANIFDFSGNKYLPLLFQGNNKFNLNFKRIYTDIKQVLTKYLNQGEPKNVHQLFDEIPANQDFAKMCAERGIDYQVWRSYDQNDFIKRKVLINITPTTRKELIASKVDMDNVIKGVTTGNESKACRAVSVGENCEAGPELVRNKMVQQVELLDNNEPVGNVLVYLAEVDGQSAIVMGTLMKKWPYDSHEIDELFIDYVRSMRSKIGRPDMPIYMSRIFSIDNLKNYPINHYQVKLLGSGDNAIFNSFAHDFEVPSDSKVNTIELYKVDEGIKSENTIIPLAKEQNNNVFNFKELLTKIFKIKQEDFLKLPVFKVRAANLIGTGFYITYRNFPFILTAKHTLEHSKSNYVEIFNDKGFSDKAEILALSKDSDLAVLTLPNGLLDYLHPYTLALKGPKVGDKVIAVGYPDAKGIEKEELTISNTYHKVNNHVLYAHDNGNMVNGSSGSPLSEALDINKLLGVVVQNYGHNSQALSVPLPQIRTFLGETIRKILFTPDLNQKFIPLYPAFAKNYENVVNKFIYPSENTEKPSEKVKGTLTAGEQSKRLKRKIPESFLTSSGYFRGMKLNSLAEVETILKEGLPISKTHYEDVFFAPDIELAFTYADNHGVKKWIPVLLRNANYKELNPVDPFKTEYVSGRDVLPEEIGDVIVWTTVDGKEGWYKATLNEDNKITLVHSDEVQAQIPTQEQQVETSWLTKLKTKIATKRTATYNKNPKNKAGFYLKEAKAAYEKENLDLAEDYYKLAIAQDPNNAKYYYELGKFYDDVYIDDYYKNLAFENYNKAITLDPKNGKYYYSRALLKKYSLQDTAGAIDDLAISMKYGMKGWATESLFKKWTGQDYEDYIKNLDFSKGQTFKPTAMETDYISTSYTGANTEKPLNLKTDIVSPDVKLTAKPEQKPF